MDCSDPQGNSIHLCQDKGTLSVSFQSTKQQSLLFKQRSLSYKLHCGGFPFCKSDVTRTWSTAFPGKPLNSTQCWYESNCLSPAPTAKGLPWHPQEISTNTTYSHHRVTLTLKSLANEKPPLSQVSINFLTHSHSCFV